MSELYQMQSSFRWALLLLLVFASLSQSTLSVTPASTDTTDWDSISTHLEDHWQEHLPPIPFQMLDLSGWRTPMNGSDFMKIDADMSTAQLCNFSHGDPWPKGLITAGSYFDCDSTESACSGGITSSTCRAVSTMNARSGMVSLLAKPGTYWAKISAQPAWVQFRFPKPAAAASAEFLFELDERYPPTAGGGNPCRSALTDDCNLCTTYVNGGPWDFSVAPGVRLLWSYPSAGRHVIDPEPVDVFGAFVDGVLNLHRSSPPGLDLRNQTEVVVTVMSFNQYPHYSNNLQDNAEYDPADPTRCTVATPKSIKSKPSTHACRLSR